MANIPDDLVLRNAISVVHRNRELNDAKIWCEVPADFCYRSYQTITDFIGKTVECRHIHRTEAFRTTQVVKQRVFILHRKSLLCLAKSRHIYN